MKNPLALAKVELLARTQFRCIHGRDGLAHRRCYDLGESRTEEVLGFTDIEASNLVATFGICYTYCILSSRGELIKRTISLDDLYNGLYDKLLVQQFIVDAAKFDRLVFHYGENRRFDLPFMRTRAVYWKLSFPEYKSNFVSDTYPILKNRFRLHSNRLETACDFFGIPSKGHKLKPSVWLKMITGNKKLMKEALKYILTHNIEDVYSLKALWDKTNKYARIGRTSI